MDAIDYFQIQNLLNSYPFALDGGRFSDVGRLLAHADVYSAGALMASKDPEAVASAFRDWVIVYADGTPRTRHYLANMIIEPDGADGALVKSYVMVFQQNDSFPLQPIIGGDYLDRLRKVAGVWRIVERRMGNDLVGNLVCHGKKLDVINPTRANAPGQDD